MSELLEAALAYAGRGWKVFPVYEPKDYGPEDRRCSCGQDDCLTPTKHPRNRTGLKGASGESAEIQKWWKGLPRASIGIATGVVSGIWVLSVSPELGYKTLADLEDEHGALPVTLQSTAGNGSRHYYFHNLSTLKLPSDALGPGLTILADGKYIIAPPSDHLSGKRYAWVESGAKMAAIPQWIVDIQQVRQRAQSEEAHKLWEPIRGPKADELDAAVELYSHFNMQRKGPPWLPFPATPAACPICPGVDCFKVSSTLDKWMCLSPLHTGGGSRVGHIFYGNVLDIDAAQRDRTPKKHLEAEGYWGKVVRLEERRKLNAEREASILGSTGTVVELAPSLAKDKALTRSFASLVEILGNPGLNAKVLVGRKLEYNEFAGEHAFDRRIFQKNDISDLMLRIELVHHDKDEVGLTFTPEAIERAMELVAARNPFHPVREYLQKLQWDGIERIDHVVSDVLGAVRDPLTSSWFKRWMVSGVARIMDPGCQADHMIVLVHPHGGEGKSTFLNILAGGGTGQWFADDVLDVHDNRKAPHALQGVWIYEWSEMESLVRAGDAGAANAFIVKRIDKYLEPYGHFMVRRPRQVIFGGTTNKVTFMRERGGRRRFLPIMCGNRIDLDQARRLRDDWWAEAVSLYLSGYKWWPDAEEKNVTDTAQEANTVQDPWHGLIIPWLDGGMEEQWVEEDGRRFKKPVERPALDETTVSDILREVIKMPQDRWTTKEEVRVGTILRDAGWADFKASRKMDPARGRRWRRSGGEGLETE